MQKALSITTVVILAACSADVVPTAQGLQQPVSLDSGYSSSSSVELYSPPVSSEVGPVSSEVGPVPIPSSAYDPIPYVRTEPKYVIETGNVCVSFNPHLVKHSQASSNYMAMTSICGNMVNYSTGTNAVTSEAVVDFLMYKINLSDWLITTIISDIGSYGTSLRFYDAVDGYLRYIYLEPVGDGIGLLKPVTEKRQ